MEQLSCYENGRLLTIFRGKTFRETIYHHPRSSAAETFFRMHQFFHDSSSTIVWIFFDSSCYRKCPAGPNSYAHVAPYDGSIFDQVGYFVMMGTESLMSGLTFAQIKLLKSQKALFLPECPDSQFFYEVESPASKIWWKLLISKKCSAWKQEKKRFLASVPQFLDHKWYASNCGAFEPYRIKFNYITIWINIIVFLPGVPILIDVLVVDNITGMKFVCFLIDKDGIQSSLSWVYLYLSRFLFLGRCFMQ